MGLRCLSWRGIEAAPVAKPALVRCISNERCEFDCAVPEYGHAKGFVGKLTNGLTACLSGDTGVHSEMKTVINEFPKANLAVLNLGVNPGIFYSGAHAINELLHLVPVILTHVNEPATEGGILDGKTHQATQAARTPRDQRAHDGVR